MDTDHQADGPSFGWRDRCLIVDGQTVEAHEALSKTADTGGRDGDVQQNPNGLNYTLKQGSPDKSVMKMVTLRMELSCRCRVLYPSSRQRLEVEPEPANSAKFRSAKPNFWNDRPPFTS